MARPSFYSEELADSLCEKLAMGLSIRATCSIDNMPSPSTVYNWLRGNSEFLEQYARAKAIAADVFSEEILDIANDASLDWIEEDGRLIVNKENIERARLRIDALKWLASKLKPKKNLTYKR